MAGVKVDGWSAPGGAQPPPPPPPQAPPPAAGHFSQAPAAGAPPPPPPPNLPSGWSMEFDENGKVFYKDHINQTTSWDPPTAPPMEPSPAPPPPPPAAPPPPPAVPPPPASVPPPPAAPAPVNEFGSLRPGEDISTLTDNNNQGILQSWGFKQQISEQEAAATLSRVRFNHKTGNPELVPAPAPGAQEEVGASVTAEDLLNEHRRKEISCWASGDDLKAEFGLPVIQYFNFVKFTIGTNLIVFLITLIGFIPHVNNAGPKLYDEGIGFMQSSAVSSLDLLFLSSVQPTSDNMWIVMIALTVVVSFLAPFVYLSAATHIFKDYDTSQDMEEVYNKSQADRISRTQEVDPGSRKFRLFASYLVFLLCLGAPILIMWALLNPALYKVLQSQYDSSQSTPDDWTEGLQLLLYLLVSLTVTVSNIIFETIVNLLTDFESHEFWHQYRNHRLWKRIIFRFTNIMALFALRFWSDLPYYTCAAGRIAFQVFVFIILDLTVNNIIEVLYPAIMDAVSWLFAGRQVNQAGDEENRPEFELSDEYFEIVYRQYIMYMGVSVFPMIAGITLVANLVEWGTDKYRLFYHCRRPRQVVVGGRRHLFAALLLSAFFALVTFPAGAVWWGGPLGPYMCWPCPQYSNYQAGGGSCGAAFDAYQCQASGAPLELSDLRARIDSLRLPEESEEYKAADKFFEENQGLFTSRRCKCRPCLNVISCACDEPILQFECEAGMEAGAAIPHLIEPSGQQCFAESGTCGVNWVWRDLMHCSTMRYQYNRVDGLAHQSKCKLLSSAGQAVLTTPEKACSTHEDCSDEFGATAFCDTYCPQPRREADGKNKDDFLPILQCWDCPEVAASSLVNPGQADIKWQTLPSDFCQKCVDQTAVCNKNSTA